MFVIGVDCGTTNVKAVLFDETGTELLIKSQENRPEYSGASNSEMDMDVTWVKTAECIRSLLEDGPADKDSIAAIGITGQGEGLWLLDKDGCPLQKAILWCDGRAAKEVHAVINAEPAVGEQIHSVTGTRPVEGTQLMLLKWMLNNRKDVLDRAGTCFFCKDWIRYKLSGKISTDFTDSGTSLLDIKKGIIADDILKLLGLQEYRHILPDPEPSDSFCTVVSEKAAAETGLKEGTPILTGGLDVSVTALGIGAVKEHDCCVIVGTTCATEVVYRQKDCRFGASDSRYEKHPLEDLYISICPAMNGTPNLDWVMKEIAGTDDFDELHKMAASEPLGARGVLYLPYISPAGERSPFHNPYARAGFFGINIKCTKATLVRAVYEGITLSIRDCFGKIDRSGTLYLAGGGAKDAMWAQMISDFMGMPVRISESRELGAKGICLMALVKLGVFETYEQAASSCCRYKAEYKPNPQNTEKCERIYDLFKSVRIAHMPLWNARYELLQYLQ